MLNRWVVSDSVWPHRRQPTRLPRPRNSPGKNTGVGCHSFCNAWKWKVKVKSLGRVRLLATPWTAAYQAPPSMGFSRQKNWSGVPLPSPVNAYGAHIICISCSKLELKWIDKSTCKIEWSMFFYSNVTGFQILCIILWNIWVIMLIGTTGEY